MNKKFSTLLAGFLLAGGLFSTANAIDVRDAKTGQYYKLERTAQYDNLMSNWGESGVTGWFWEIKMETSCYRMPLRMKISIGQLKKE